MSSLLRRASSPSTRLGRRKRSVIADDFKVSDTSDIGGGIVVRRNKQRVLLVPSRGITSQMRHLVTDLEALMPHCKKDSKLDSKSNLHIINELSELNNCNNTLYFEGRKHQDLYLWASKTPNGPSAKLFVQNVHTMDELKMTGNCLKGSRPILSFDGTFESGDAHWRLLKEMFVQMFSVPRSSRRAKPFIDRVISFSVLDGKIWFRNYQIAGADASRSRRSAALYECKEGSGEADGADEPTLIEIGPRFVMTPVKIFEGSFGGATIYENPEYVSPNTVRRLEHRKNIEQHKVRVRDQDALRAKVGKLRQERKVDEFARNRVFA